MNTHCNRHIIPADVVTLEDFTLSDEEELEIALGYLKSKNIKPEFGDLIVFDIPKRYRNDGIAIFDGEKIINLDCEPDDYGTLPQMFRVIELCNGKRFPIKYWHTYDKDNNTLGITHNSIVWFDHQPYFDQLIDNITYDDSHFNGKFSLYTSFIADDGNRYFIICCYQQSDIDYDYDTCKVDDLEEAKQLFLDQLEKEELIPLESNSFEGYYDIEEPSDSNNNLFTTHDNHLFMTYFN